MFSRIAILASASLILAGCIDQINADLPAPPNVLVVNSVLTPDSTFRVQVSRVASTVDSSSRLLTAANVYLLVPGRGELYRGSVQSSGGCVLESWR